MAKLFKDFIRCYADGGGEGEEGNTETDAAKNEGTDDGQQKDSDNQDVGKETDGKTFDEKYVKDLRAENAKYRTERRDEKEKAEKLQIQLKAIQKALGLEGEEPDPDKLQKELQSSKSELRGLKIEIAFNKAAKKAGADEDLTYAVLHRRGVLDTLELDGTLSTALEELIEQELKNNPKLKAETGGTGNTGDTGGSSGNDDKVSFNDLFRKAAGRA